MSKVTVIIGGSNEKNKVMSELPIYRILKITKERAETIIELTAAAIRQNETWEEAYDEIVLTFGGNERDYALIILGALTDFQKDMEAVRNA